MENLLVQLSEENQQLLEEKIARLEKALILETRADERLRLEHEIQALKENPTDFISSLSQKNHKNQYIMIGIGGFLLIVVFIGIFLVPRSNVETKVETNITNTTNAATVNNIGTQVNHIHQYDLEIVKKLGVTEEKLKITEVAFQKFLDIAGEKKVPIEQLPTIMEQMAERYKSALEGVKNLENSDDPEVKQLIQQAEQLLREKVDLDQAEKLLNQAHAKKKDKKSRLKEMLHKEEVEQSAISFQAGEVKFTQLKYKEAEEYYRRAAEELPKDEETLLALYLNKTALAMEKMGKYTYAIPLAKKALDIREKILGKEHIDVAEILNNLATLYFFQGKYNQGIPLEKKALEIREKILGSEHIEIVKSLNNLANLYFSQGKYEQAIFLIKRALKIKEKTLGKEHSEIAQSLNILGNLYYSQGMYEQAESLYKQALDIFEKILGKEHPNIAASLNNLATVYKAQKKYAQAEPLYQQALDKFEKVLGEEHPNVAASLNNLATVYKAQGKYAQAELLYQQALDKSEKMLGKEHPNTKKFRENYELMKKEMAKKIEKAVQ